MKRDPLKGLVIRTGVVRLPDFGFILACDPKKEEDEIEHTVIYTWDAGEFFKGETNFDANSGCIIQDPELGFVVTAGTGGYSIRTRDEGASGNIFSNSSPEPEEPRYGQFRSVSEIGGKAYAVGLRGMVYRLDTLGEWTRIDDGLSRDFNGQAIHGTDGSNVYAVGRHGEMWHFTGEKWSKESLPTDRNLTAVKCLPDGTVYIGGDKGILIRGGKGKWETVDNQEVSEGIWDIEWFEEKLYVSTMGGLYTLEGDKLKPVEFGDDEPKTTYHLSVAEKVMWSIGSKDVMALEDHAWKRIV